VVVVNVNAVLGGELLKSVLGGNSFDEGIINLVVHKTQPGVMVDKDGAASVPLLVEFPFQLGEESHFGRYHLRLIFSKPDIEIPGGSEKRTKNFGEGDKDG